MQDVKSDSCLGPNTMAVGEVSVESFPASAANTISTNPMMQPNAKNNPAETNQNGEGHSGRFVENSINLSLLDPPRFGWTVAGGVGDVLPPHQSARRAVAKRSLDSRRFGVKRARPEGTLDGRASDKGSMELSVHSEPVERKVTIGPGAKPGSLPDFVASPPVAEEQVPTGRFTAMQGGMLNVKIYHRGIEGDEPRDQQTGELRFPTKPSDTNHDADGPRSLEATITLHFPLTDTHSTGSDESSFYRQTIKWDLGNSSTPTPMMFALTMGTEFGLSYPEILDLAASIQKQLNVFCMDKCSSAVPALVKSGNVPKPMPILCNLYGDVLGFGSIGGSELSNLPKKPILSGSQRSTSSLTSRPSTRTKAEKDVSKKKLAPVSSERTPVSIEKVFFRQVLLRLKNESDDYIRTHWANYNTGVLGVRDAGPARCHLCQSDYDKCVLYPCGILGHTICENHMLQKHGISLQSGSQAMPDCPICTLRCGCSVCNCKLGLLAARLKTMCVQQGRTPSTTPCNGIHAQCVAITLKDCKEFLRSSGSARNFLLRPQVPKVGPAAFPREVIDGIEIDQEYEQHYDVIFSSSGSRKIGAKPETANKTSGSSYPSQPNATGIDGNVDYCMACNKAGSLVCCDVCPRAFHAECLADGTAASVEGSLWECPSCRSEKDGLKFDLLDGLTQIEPIKAVYAGTDNGEMDSNLLISLSIVLEMVDLLMQYDFGYMFRTPVDTKQVPNYNSVIKSPMDLGTIKSRICTGKYKEPFGDGYSLENVVLAALKDIELVWHNCLLFNVEFSAVYRMAGVLSRRAAAIRQKSFEGLLPNQVKTDLARYVESLAMERAEARKVAPPQAASTPRNRHKVANCAKGGPQRRRPIVALDPDTGMITKIYSTMLSLSNAVNIMTSRGLMCEYTSQEIDNTNKLRTFVTRSAGDPSIRLFGYRWIFLDDLYSKKTLFQDDMYASIDFKDDFVQQPKKVPQWTIVVENAAGKVYYRNLEEALSLINIQRDNEAEPLSRKVKAGEKQVLSDGVWIYEINIDASSNKPTILKQDVVASGRTLTGFSSIVNAFMDWRDTVESSVCEYSGALSLDVFKNFFLDKERNIDGIKYFSAPSEESKPEDTVMIPDVKIECPQPSEKSTKHEAAERLDASVSPRDELTTVETVPVAIVEAPTVGVHSLYSFENSQQQNHCTTAGSCDEAPITSENVGMTNTSNWNGQNIRSDNVSQIYNAQNGKNPATTLKAPVRKLDSIDMARKLVQQGKSNGYVSAGDNVIESASTFHASG